MRAPVDAKKSTCRSMSSAARFKREILRRLPGDSHAEAGSIGRLGRESMSCVSSHRPNSGRLERADRNASAQSLRSIGLEAEIMAALILVIQVSRISNDDGRRRECDRAGW